MAQEIDLESVLRSYFRVDPEKPVELTMWTNNEGRIVAKIERSEASPRLEEIVRASDAVMVARGDLGVEVGYAQLTGLQKRILHLARTQYAGLNDTRLAESLKSEHGIQLSRETVRRILRSARSNSASVFAFMTWYLAATHAFASALASPGTVLAGLSQRSSGARRG